MDGDDVFMAHGGRRLRFSRESLAGYRIAGQVGCKHLDRHPALQSRVEGLDHEAHAALA